MCHVARVKAKLSAEVSRVQRVLASNTECQVNVEGLIDGQDFGSSLTRAKFDALTESVRAASSLAPSPSRLSLSPSLAQVWRKAQRVLDEFVLTAEGNFDRVLLSGGHCKLPRLTTLLAAVFPAAALVGATDIDPLLAVASGAALHAQSMQRLGDKDSAPLRTVHATTRAIGLRVRDQPGAATTLIARDTPLPVLRRVRLKLKEAATAADVARVLEVVEGEYFEAVLEGEAEPVQVDADAGDASAYERVLVRCALPPQSKSVIVAIKLDEHAHLVHAALMCYGAVTVR